MKKQLPCFALISTLVAAPVFAMQAMDPNMPGMQPEAKPSEAQGVGVVKAIDATQSSITLQHQAITSIGWPAMTMTFKLDSPDLLKEAKVGDKVQFTLRLEGMGGVVTSVKPVR